MKEGSLVTARPRDSSLRLATSSQQGTTLPLWVFAASSPETIVQNNLVWIATYFEAIAKKTCYVLYSIRDHDDLLTNRKLDFKMIMLRRWRSKEEKQGP